MIRCPRPARGNGVSSDPVAKHKTVAALANEFFREISAIRSTGEVNGRRGSGFPRPLERPAHREREYRPDQAVAALYRLDRSCPAQTGVGHALASRTGVEHVADLGAHRQPEHV